MKERLQLESYEEIYRIVNGTTYIISNPHTEYGHNYKWDVRLFREEGDLRCICFGVTIRDKEHLKDLIDDIINEEFYEAGISEMSNSCDKDNCKYIKQLECALMYTCEELEKKSKKEWDNDYYKRTSPILKEKWKEIAMNNACNKK